MSKKLTTQQYIDKCKVTHGKKYDYLKLKYINSDTKVNIICRKHGVFKQWPSDHRRGFGCPTCSGKVKGNTERFIKKAIEVHGIYYNYSKVKYKSLGVPITIICPKHNQFKVIPRYHIYGSAIGCAKCNRSKGEIKIEEWLIENKIKFEAQKTFKGLGTSRFDFYLPDYNFCIEFDGAQHFHVRHQRTRDKVKAEQRFKDLKRRDKKKNDYCKREKIKLIRIHFKQFNNIIKILNHEVLRHPTS